MKQFERVRHGVHDRVCHAGCNRSRAGSKFCSARITSHLLLTMFFLALSTLGTAEQIAFVRMRRQRIVPSRTVRDKRHRTDKQ